MTLKKTCGLHDLEENFQMKSISVYHSPTKDVLWNIRDLKLGNEKKTRHRYLAACAKEMNVIISWGITYEHLLIE